jgi:hypothetical protein
MASRRYRSQRTTAGQVDNLVKRLSYIEKRPTPKKLLARVVTTATVAPQAVTAPKLADNSVTANAISSNAVTTDAIAANAVTITEMAANSVSSIQIVPGSIMASDIGFTAADIGASTSITSATAPVNPAVGDLWFDTSNSNKLSRWSGSAWVSVQDLGIAAANAAAAAANTAAVAANLAANAAQTTANSKNKVVRSTSAASGTTGYSAGDIWWQMDSTSATANVTGQWTFDGTKWNVNTITNSVIANLDAAKITTGYLAAGRIDANTITANMISANSITAAKIAANAVTAVAIAANTITAGQIAASTITGDKIYGTAIDGKTITGAIIQSSADTAATRSVISGSSISGYKYAPIGSPATSTLIGTINIDPGASVYAYDGSPGPYPLQSVPSVVLTSNKSGTYNGYSMVVSAKGYSTAVDGIENFITHITSQDSLTNPSDAGSFGIQMESKGQNIYLYGGAIGLITDLNNTLAITVNGTSGLTGSQALVSQGGYWNNGGAQSTFPTIAITARQIGWFSGTITSVSGGLPGDMVFSY